jgi:hypothetical protein
VDKDQGCADAVMGFKKAPDTLASEGEEVVSPSYSISTCFTGLGGQRSDCND